MNWQIFHTDIFHFVDQKLCYSGYDYNRYRQKNNGKYFKIRFSTGSLEKGEIFVCYEDERGKYWGNGNRIAIYRKQKDKPHKSYVDEIATLLHEYGHHISLTNGIAKEDCIITEKNYIYGIGKTIYNDRSVVLREEINAWKHAISNVFNIPVSNIIKIIILIYVCLVAPKKYLFIHNGKRRNNRLI